MNSIFKPVAKLHPSEVLNFLDPTTSINFDLKPETALQFFKAKGLKATFDWRDMLGKEHDAAFTVAKMLDIDLLKEVRGQLDQALENGETFKQFADGIIPKLQKAGWWGKKDMVDPITGKNVLAQLGSPHRLQTIFRTNLMSAYAVGQWEQIEESKDDAPYLMYDAVDDFRTRATHKQFDNMVRPIDDPVWESIYPPNDYNCRCGVIQLSQDDLDGLGITVSKPKKLKKISWTNPRTGQSMKVVQGIGPGFNHNPGKARYSKLKQIEQEKIGTLPPDMQKAAKKADQDKLLAQQAAQAKASAILEAENTAAELQKQKIAQDTIDQAKAANTPHLAKAITTIQATKAGQSMTPVELLDAALTKAEKTKQSAGVAHYKQAIIAGKVPGQGAQAAFNSLDEAQQIAIKQELAEKSGATAAMEKLADIASNPKGQQLKNKALTKYLAGGGTITSANAKKLLADIELQAAEAQAKASLASQLSGYKKKVLEGKLPTPSQTAAFNSLDEAGQAKVLADIDAKKAELEPEQVTKPETQLSETDAAMVAKLEQKMVPEMDPDDQHDWLFEKVFDEDYSLDIDADQWLKKQIIGDGIDPGDVIDEYNDLVSAQMAKIIGKTEQTPAVKLAGGSSKDVAAASAEAQKLLNKKAPEGTTPEETYDIQAEWLIEKDIDGDYDMDIAADEWLAAYMKDYDPDDFDVGHLAGTYNKMIDDAANKLLDDVGDIQTPGTSGLNFANMTKIGPQKGSNPGGLYQDTETGTQWYIKTPNDPDQAKNEILAAKLYQEAGIDVPELQEIMVNGKLSIASKIIDGLQSSPAKIKASAKANEGFAVDAWLANWDVVGLDYDNMLVKGNKIYRVDTGGALSYRAQGGKKGEAFGNDVPELDTLRDAATNAQSAAVFKNIKKAQLIASAEKVKAISDDKIKEIVQQFGPGTALERQALADKLIARKADVITKLLPTIDDKQKKQALESFRSQVTSDADATYDAILTAIKGIATRAASKGVIEQKDITRVKEAKEKYDSLLANQTLTIATKKQVVDHFGKWIVAMEKATEAGVGAKYKKWTPPGTLGQYTGIIDIDEGKIDFSQYKAKLRKYTDAKAGDIILKAFGSLAAKMNIPYYSGSEHFKKMPINYQRAISGYTGSWYSGLIERAIANKLGPEQKAYIDLLNDALESATVKHKGEIARSLDMRGKSLDNFIDAHKAAMKTGMTINTYTPASWKRGDEGAWDSQTVVLHMKKSTKGVYVNPISIHHGVGEDEVTMPILDYKVKRVTQDKDGLWHITVEE